MKLNEIADPRLASALGRIQQTGRRQRRSIDKQKERISDISQSSYEFKQHAAEMLNVHPELDLEDFIHHMSVKYPQGDLGAAYFDWERAYEEARKNSRRNSGL